MIHLYHYRFQGCKLCILTGCLALGSLKRFQKCKVCNKPSRYALNNILAHIPNILTALLKGQKIQDHNTDNRQTHSYSYTFHVNKQGNSNCSGCTQHYKCNCRDCSPRQMKRSFQGRNRTLWTKLNLKLKNKFQVRIMCRLWPRLWI